MPAAEQRDSTDTAVPRVVIDTSVYVRTAGFTSSRWHKLAALAASGDVEIVIPEVVVAEVRRRFTEGLRSAHQKIVRANIDLRRLGVDREHVEELDETVVADTWAALEERLGARGIRRRPVPAVPHADLIRRDLETRKPFAASGKGYRDSLIWHTVLAEWADQEGPLALVTDNTGDFADDDHPADLHPDLLDDQRGHPDRSVVKLFPNVEALLAGWFPTPVQKASARRERDTTDELVVTPPRSDDDAARAAPGALHAELVANISSHLETHLVGELLPEPYEESWGELVREPFHIPDEFNDVTVDHAEVEGDTLQMDVVERYEGGDELINIEIDVMFGLDGYVQKGDYAAMSDEETSGLDVWDYDWNEYTMWVRAERRVVTSWALLLTRDTGQVLDLTMTAIG